MNERRWGIMSFPVREDRRGRLTYAESHVLPFPVLREFWITGWPQGAERGHHAHKQAEQLFVVLQGAVEFAVETPEGQVVRQVLRDPNRGLFIPALHWLVMTARTDNVVLLCHCSAPFAEHDYLHDHAVWQARCQRPQERAA